MGLGTLTQLANEIGNYVNKHVMAMVVVGEVSYIRTPVNDTRLFTVHY